MSKRLEAKHGIICRLAGEEFSYFGWPSTAELDDGSLYTAYYQKVTLEEKCSLLGSRWKLPK